jgi:hypothetical protein
MLGRLKNVLDNIGPGVHDVCYLDCDGEVMTSEDLMYFGFDEIPVISKSENVGSTPEWRIINLHLDVKKYSSVKH